jgi:hypothetical protein
LKKEGKATAVLAPKNVGRPAPHRHRHHSPITTNHNHNPQNNTHPLAPHTTYHLATTQHTHCYSWSSCAIATNNHTTYNTSACCGCGLVPLNLPLVRQVDKSKLMLLLALVHICSCSQIRLSWLNRSTLVSRADFTNLSLKMM